MTDIVERLRVWPAAYGEDAMSSTYVGGMAKSAADRIEELENIIRAILTEDVRHVMDEWPDTKTVIGHIDLPPLRKARTALSPSERGVDK